MRRIYLLAASLAGLDGAAANAAGFGGGSGRGILAAGENASAGSPVDAADGVVPARSDADGADEQEGGPDVDDADPDERPSSESRKGKRYEAMYEMLGSATVLGTRFGAFGGYYLDSDHLLELSFVAGRASDDANVLSMSKASQKDANKYYVTGTAWLLSARYKAFVGNSFYYTAGAAQRHTKIDVAYATAAVPDDHRRMLSAEATDLGGVAGIGNAWHWESFSLGCDWVGLYVPLIRMKKSSSVGPGTETLDEDAEKQRKAAKASVHGGGLQVLRFYLGASF